MNRRLLAVVTALVLLAVVALINTRRAGRDSGAPAPTPSVSRSTDPLPILQPTGCPRADQTIHFEFGIGVFIPRAGVDVIATRCSDNSGIRYPSKVVVRDDADDHRILAVLVDPAANEHVAELSSTAGSVTVTASDWSSPERRDQFGNVYRQTFTTVDGTTYLAKPRVLLARACQPADLATVASRGATTDAAVLRFRNISKVTCALEGYPTVAVAEVAVEAEASAAPRTSLPVARAARVGPTGGLSHDTAPPVILLTPGGSAAALLDSADGPPTGGVTLCSRVTRIQVGLMSGTNLGEFPLAIWACDFEVHPLLPGARGTDF